MGGGGGGGGMERMRRCGCCCCGCCCCVRVVAAIVMLAAVATIAALPIAPAVAMVVMVAQPPVVALRLLFALFRSRPSSRMACRRRIDSVSISSGGGETGWCECCSCVIDHWDCDGNTGMHGGWWVGGGGWMGMRSVRGCARFGGRGRRCDAMRCDATR